MEPDDLFFSENRWNIDLLVRHLEWVKSKISHLAIPANVAC